jgi:AcrR family transcriptional regulator
MAPSPDPKARSAPEERLSLSDLVTRTGVPASTIHYYRRSGMIPPPVRIAPNRFGYDQSHVEALMEIRGCASSEQPEQRGRIVAAAIEAFKTRSYSEVTVSDIAEAAHTAKGNLYRYFDSKEDLLTAAVEALLDDTRVRFEAASGSLGGIEGFRADPGKAALVFGYIVADVLPMLLELGARAAKGHEPSADLARKVLRTLAGTAGRPFVDAPDDGEAAIQAGLRVIETAFATVLSWSVGTDWPPDHLGDPDAATGSPT